MKTLILLFIMFSSFYTKIFADFIDLGVRGKQYEIKEKSFKDEIAGKLKEFDYMYWEKEMISQADKSMIVSSNLESCKKNNQWVYDPTITIQEDIIIPYYNKVAYKKGYKYNTLKENNIQFKKYMFFIDADDTLQVLLAAKYSKNADIFVVKGDLKNLQTHNLEGMVFRKDIEGKSFKINCLPSVYTQDQYTFKVNEYKLGD